MIPEQLQKDDFRFIKIGTNKVAIEERWQIDNNYSYKEANFSPYGVVCGFGNLIVIDFDSKEAQDRYYPHFPQTFTVKTAGKGLFHLYFITDTPITKRLNQDGVRLADIQGKGTYVVGAGSIIGERTYDIVRHGEIAFLKYEQIKKIFANIWTEYDQQTLKDIQSLEGVQQGQRDEIAFKKACSLLAKGIEQADVWDILLTWNKRNNPPLSNEQLHKCLKSALKYDYSDSLVPKTIIGKEYADLELISVKDAIEKGVPVIDYVIDPFLRVGGLTIIGGEPGAKKSLLSMMMSICIVKGVPLFDNYQCKKLKVCYLDFENGYAVMVNRYNSLLLGNFSGEGTLMDSTEDITLSVFNDLKLDLPEHKYKLKKIIEETGADVFIIDSLVRCMQGEEDKATDVRRVFDNLKDFMADGKSFIVLHHTRKDNHRGMSGLRGSSDLGGMAEIVLMLSASGEKGKFTNVELAKHRHLGRESIEDWGFMIDDELFGEGSNYLKLKYYQRDPDNQSKYEECMAEITQWIDENYKRGDIFKTSACSKAMDKLGGYSRQMTQKCLKEHVTKKIIRNSEKKGFWIVE